MPAPTDAARSPMPRGYEYVRILGSGGCGWVALARQSALDRLVAVKILYSGRYDEDERRRLEREGRALARLRDSRILGVYAMETVGDDLALVLEFVAGGDLSDALAGDRLSGAGLLRALTDVAGALDHAAAAGIVHRDVKPGNVMLTRDGRAKLGDFGLARLAASAGAFRTAGAAIIGTPLYMAPEQINDPEHESPAGDAYSFTAMVYEALLRRPPFEVTDTLQLLWAHTNSEPTPPRVIRPTLSADADAVLLAGLAKDPAMRPTPGQLMAVLAAHPQDWSHIVTAGSAPPPPDGRQAEPRRTTLPSAPERPGGDVVAPSVRGPASAVPWVKPPVYRPPVAPTTRRRIPPVVIGRPPRATPRPHRDRRARSVLAHRGAVAEQEKPKELAVRSNEYPPA